MSKTIKILFIFCSLVFISCGKQDDVQKYDIGLDKIQHFVNNKTVPVHADLNVDKALFNDSYPIQIALYKNNKFYYNLPTLTDGDGQGTWKYQDGVITLFAQRRLFDMYIEVFATDENAQSLGITFIDRFGKNTIQMTNKNLPTIQNDEK